MTFVSEDDTACDQDLLPLSRSAVKIGKLSTIYTLGQLVPRLVGIVLLPIFTHYLKPEQMGIVTLAGRISGPLMVFVHLGLCNALQRLYFLTEEVLRPKLVRTVLLGQVVQAVVICTLLSVGGIWLADVLLPNLPLGPGYLFGLWLMIVWGCFFGAWLQFGVAMAQLLERAGLSVGMTSSRYLVQAGLGVAAVAGLGWKGFGRQGTIFLATALVAIATLPVVWRCGRGGFDFSLFKRVFRSGLTFVPNSLSGLLGLALNAWLLNSMASSAALGTYAVAVLFPQLMQIPYNSLISAAYPTLAKLMGDGGKEARRQQSRLYTLLITGNVGIALGVALFVPIAIQILTDPSYHEAARVAPILVMAWLLLGLSVIVGQTVFVVGGGLWLSAATVASVIVNVALCLALIPRYGIYGAAWAMFGGFAARLVVSAWVSCYLYRLPWELTKILRAIGCAGALAIADRWLSPGLSLAGAIALKTALLTAMVPALWGLGVVSTAECKRARDVIFGKVRAWRGRNR